MLTMSIYHASLPIPSPRASSMSLYSPIHDILTTTSNYTYTVKSLHDQYSYREINSTTWPLWSMTCSIWYIHPRHWYPSFHVYSFSLSLVLWSTHFMDAPDHSFTISILFHTLYPLPFLPPSISASPPPYLYMIFTSHPPLSIIHRYSPASMVCYDQHAAPSPIR